MRVRAPYEGDVEHARQLHVGHVAPLAGDEPRILLAGQRRPDDARGAAAAQRETPVRPKAAQAKGWGNARWVSIWAWRSATTGPPASRRS